MATMTLPSVPNLTPEGNLSRYLQDIRKFPMLAHDHEFMLAKAWREHDDVDSAHQLVTSHLRPGRQDRLRLPRLRPAAGGTDLRRQCRSDASGPQVRSGPRLPPGHLRHVVDSRRHPGIHPAFLVAGEDGYDGGAEEAVLQSAGASRASCRRSKRAT